jgi:hypothetical protein
MSTTAQVNQLIDECFTGQRERECDNCPADHWKGGTCCYGDTEKREESDPSCQNCQHFYDCGAEVKAAERERQPRYHQPTSRSKVMPNRVRQGRFSGQRGGQPDLVQIGAQRSRNAPVRSGPRSGIYQPPPAQPRPENQTLFERWYKDTAWGGLQGLSEASAWFFQSYYWK